MKITGLNASDFEHIERAFCYTVGDQLLHARHDAQCGEFDKCEMWLNSARDLIRTYKKIDKAEEGYKER